MRTFKFLSILNLKIMGSNLPTGLNGPLQKEIEGLENYAKPMLSVLSGIIQATTPFFIVLSIGVPVGALVYAMNSESLRPLNYVHVMAGTLWTGIDIYLGFVLGPVLGRLDPGERVAVFKRLMPRMTFLMPVLVGVTFTSAFELANRIGLPLDSRLIIAALVVAGILGIQGLGFLLPNEVRIFRQLLSAEPDTGRIGQLACRTPGLPGSKVCFSLPSSSSWLALGSRQGVMKIWKHRSRIIKALKHLSQPERLLLLKWVRIFREKAL